MATSEAEVNASTPQLPVLPKATVKKPVRPDFTVRDTQVSKLLDKVQEFQKRAKEITKQLDDIHAASRGNNKQEKCKRDLADIRHLKQQLQKRRDNARAKLQEFGNFTGGKSAVKKSMQVVGAEEISGAMASLQNTLNTTRDPEQQQRIVEQIQKLHASYEQISGEKMTSESSQKLRIQLSAEISTCTSELEALAPAEEAARARLEQLQAEQQATEPDIQGLKEEREQCNEIINQLRDKATEIRQDWQEKFAAFKEQMDLWKAEQDELRSQRDAYFSAEREQRDLDRKARDLEVMGAPFTEEILRCDQLLVWCRKYKTEETHDVPAASVDTPMVLAGFVTRTKVKKEEEDDMFSLSKSRNKKEKKGGRKSHSSAAGEPKTKLQLDMDALALFSKLRLPVPSTVAEVNELAGKVVQKKAEYLDKQKRALAGEVIEQETPEVVAKASPSKAAKGTILVDMRSDEVFGTVLLELMVA